MRCVRCGKNRAKYEIEFFIGLRKGKEELCEACYAESGWGEENGVRVRLLSERACPVCGGTMEDYVRTGLVGCAACYDAFRTELTPYVEKMQAGTRHRGKNPPIAEKQEVVREIEKMLREKRLAEETGDRAHVKKLSVRIAEWQSLLFGDEE